MFVRIKDKPNGKKSIQIVESYRRADKVSQKIIRHVGQAVSDREVAEPKRLAESMIVELSQQRQPVLPIFAPEDIYCRAHYAQECEDEVQIKHLREEQRVVEGIGEVFGKLYEDLGLGELLGRAQADAAGNEILKACVLARVANPASKRRTASLLEEDYGIKIPLEKIYRMMDRLAVREEEVKRRVAQATVNLFGEVEVLFFDVTTLSFESIATDELRQFGFSKDHKFNESQVVLALVTTTGGLPLTYQLFPGSLYEGHSLVAMVQEIRRVYSVARVTLVADRAMFGEENLRVLEAEGIRYVVAARLRKLGRDLTRAILTDEDFRPAEIEGEFHWVKEFTRGERRLVVSYSAARARKDAADRSRLVERLLKKVKDGKVQLRQVMTNYGSRKYLDLKDKAAVVNEAKIAQDAQWDGLHGVITNDYERPAAEILARYRGLWEIEEAFRVSKHDLKFRPIYHFTEARIRAHVLICFLSLALAKQAVYRLARQQEPMSFEQLRNELLHVQASLVVDRSTGKRYLLPSHVTVKQKKIYQAFGLKRSESARTFP